MSDFYYEYADENGYIKSGTIEAVDMKAALSQLSSNGYKVTELRESKVQTDLPSVLKNLFASSLHVSETKKQAPEHLTHAEGMAIHENEEVEHKSIEPPSGRSRAITSLESDMTLESALEKLGFLKHIPDELCTKLKQRFSKVTFEQEDFLLSQGRSGKAFFILTKGVISVWADVDKDEQIKIAEMRPVTYFGEIALLEESDRTSTLIAEEYVEVFVLGKKDFLELIFSVPKLRKDIEKMVEERKKNTDSKLLSYERSRKKEPGKSEND